MTKSPGADLNAVNWESKYERVMSYCCSESVFAVFYTNFHRNFKNIPYREEYFVDSIHFSPLGMKFLAQSLGDVIVNWIRE